MRVQDHRQTDRLITLYYRVQKQLKNKKLDRGRGSSVTVEFGQSKSLSDSKSAKNRREKDGIQQEIR